jgi:hypothetical protein
LHTYVRGGRRELPHSSPVLRYVAGCPLRRAHREEQRGHILSRPAGEACIRNQRVRTTVPPRCQHPTRGRGEVSEYRVLEECLRVPLSPAASVVRVWLATPHRAGVRNVGTIVGLHALQCAFDLLNPRPSSVVRALRRFLRTAAGFCCLRRRLSLSRAAWCSREAGLQDRGAEGAGNIQVAGGVWGQSGTIRDNQGTIRDNQGQSGDNQGTIRGQSGQSRVGRGVLTKNTG